jgi:hypothetical protein
MKPKITIPQPRQPTAGEGLGAKIERTLFNFVRSLIDGLGYQIVQLGAWVGTEFLEMVEPILIKRGQGVVRRLLQEPALPPELRSMLEDSLAGRAEIDGVAIWIASLLGSYGAISQIAMMGWGDYLQQIAGRYRLSRPDMQALTAMLWRKSITPARYEKAKSDQGWPDDYANALAEVMRPRLSESDLAELRRRRPDLASAIRGELAARGWPDYDIGLWEALRTRLPDASVIVQAYLRGEKDEGTALNDLMRQGFTDGDARLLLRLARWIPGPSDLVRFAVRDVYNSAIVQRYGYDEDYPTQFERDLIKAGGTAEWARSYWRSHWELPSVTLGFEMLHRGIISLDDMRTLLKIADYPSFWRERMIQAAYNPLTRVDVRRMYGLGVINRDQVKRAYLDLGYDDRNATLLTEFTIRYEDDDGSNKLAEYRKLTRSIIEKAYRLGRLSRTEALAKLRDVGYQETDAAMLLDLVDAAKQVDDLPDLTRDARHDIRSITERAYLRGSISLEDATAALRGVGFSTAEAQLILDTVEFGRQETLRNTHVEQIGEAYINGQMSRTEAVNRLNRLGLSSQHTLRLFEQWDIQTTVRTRGLTEAQYRKALSEGIISLEEYRKGLMGIGYSDQAIDILVRLYQAGKPAE